MSMPTSNLCLQNCTQCWSEDASLLNATPGTEERHPFNQAPPFTPLSFSTDGGFPKTDYKGQVISFHTGLVCFQVEHNSVPSTALLSYFRQLGPLPRIKVFRVDGKNCHLQVFLYTLQTLTYLNSRNNSRGQKDHPILLNSQRCTNIS